MTSEGEGLVGLNAGGLRNNAEWLTGLPGAGHSCISCVCCLERLGDCAFDRYKAHVERLGHLQYVAGNFTAKGMLLDGLLCVKMRGMMPAGMASASAFGV